MQNEAIQLTVLCDDFKTLCLQILITVKGAVRGGTDGVNKFVVQFVDDVAALLACDQFMPSVPPYIQDTPAWQLQNSPASA